MTGALTGVPSTLAQQGIWFAERGGDTGSAYHLAMTLTVLPALDPDRLTRAWQAVVRGQPAMSCAVRDEDGVPVLVPAGPSAVVFRPVAAAELDATVDALVRTGFELTTGPLVRCTALGVDDGRQVLVIVAHHLVFDGTSKELLAAALTRAYHDPSTVDGEVDLAELGCAVAEQDRRIAGDLAAARQFWAGRFQEPGAVLLPGLAAGPDLPGPGIAVAFELPGAVLGRCTDLGVTRFELVLAAVHALLARYGNENAAVAVDMSTRTVATAGQIGYWVNELPVAIEVDREAGFRDLAARTRAALRAAYRYRETPLSRAVPGLTPRAAMAPVSVSYRRRPQGSEPAFPGHDTRVDWLVFPRTARNALHLHLVDDADGVRGTVQVPQAIPAGTARRIAGHLQTLLTAAVRDPQTAVGDLPLLSEDERAGSRSGNDTGRPRSGHTVVDLFERRVAEAPDAVAVRFERKSLSYRQVSDAANRIANGLRRRGVGPGDLVGISAQRGTGLVTGVLGILKSGAAYLPLDPGYPQARLAYIAGDAGAKLILGTPGGQLADVVPLDGFAGEASDRPGVEVDADSLAYTIYTSGSTGHPKGVDVPHRALSNLLLSFADLLDAGPGHRWLALTSLSFDISGLELFLPLICGGRVVVAPEAAGRDGVALRQLIEDEGVTHVQATPTSWQLLLAAGLPACGITALCGGEPLPLPLAQRLRGRVTRLFNVYGPTETTIWSTAGEVPPDPVRVTLGRPLANTTLHILDRRLVEVPAGVPGELCIGGAGLARGYRGRAELTAERFVTRPGTAERLYRTGDLVRRGEDGELEFLGRLDNQVKLRGHRVELGEIEQTLLRVPGVVQAAVAVHEDGSPEPRLVAYLVSTAELDEEALRGAVARELPRYMAPAGYVRLAELPRTPNGKLDRAALPAPAHPGRAATEHAASPGGAAQPQPEPQPAADGGLTAQVTGIWREVLGFDDIAPDDTLYDLGGHSLTIMQITARITKAMNVEVPFDVFFDTPTIEGIVAAIEELRAEGSGA